MFTGIVEEVGHVRSIARQGLSAVVAIEGALIFDDMHVGDSIAVNGVCLTVTSFAGRVFTADVMHETLDRSSLGQLGPGGAVNLERALPANGRFGGHIVSGHIDGTGTIASIRHDANAIWFGIDAPAALMRYIVEKGSVAIDGISLTVARVEAGRFFVSIIPHTAQQTTLGLRRVGDIVNLENDIVGKYVEKLMTPATRADEAGRTAQSAGLTEDFLLQNGFL